METWFLNENVNLGKNVGDSKWQCRRRCWTMCLFEWVENVWVHMLCDVRCCDWTRKRFVKKLFLENEDGMKMWHSYDKIHQTLHALWKVRE